MTNPWIRLANIGRAAKGDNPSGLVGKRFIVDEAGGDVAEVVDFDPVSNALTISYESGGTKRWDAGSFAYNIAQGHIREAKRAQKGYSVGDVLVATDNGVRYKIVEIQDDTVRAEIEPGQEGLHAYSGPSVVEWDRADVDDDIAIGNLRVAQKGITMNHWAEIARRAQAEGQGGNFAIGDKVKDSNGLVGTITSIGRLNRGFVTVHWSDDPESVTGTTSVTNIKKAQTGSPVPPQINTPPKPAQPNQPARCAQAEAPAQAAPPQVPPQAAPVGAPQAPVAPPVAEQPVDPVALGLGEVQRVCDLVSKRLKEIKDVGSDGAWLIQDYVATSGADLGRAVQLLENIQSMAAELQPEEGKGKGKKAAWTPRPSRKKKDDLDVQPMFDNIDQEIRDMTAEGKSAEEISQWIGVGLEWVNEALSKAGGDKQAKEKKAGRDDPWNTLHAIQEVRKRAHRDICGAWGRVAALQRAVQLIAVKTAQTAFKPGGPGWDDYLDDVDRASARGLDRGELESLVTEYVTAKGDIPFPSIPVGEVAEFVRELVDDRRRERLPLIARTAQATGDSCPMCKSSLGADKPLKKVKGSEIGMKNTANDDYLFCDHCGWDKPVKQVGRTAMTHKDKNGEELSLGDTVDVILTDGNKENAKVIKINPKYDQTQVEYDANGIMVRDWYYDEQLVKKAGRKAMTMPEIVKEIKDDFGYFDDAAVKQWLAENTDRLSDEDKEMVKNYMTASRRAQKYQIGDIIVDEYGREGEVVDVVTGGPAGDTYTVKYDPDVNPLPAGDTVNKSEGDLKLKGRRAQQGLDVAEGDTLKIKQSGGGKAVYKVEKIEGDTVTLVSQEDLGPGYERMGPTRVTNTISQVQDMLASGEAKRASMSPPAVPLTLLEREIRAAAAAGLPVGAVANMMTGVPREIVAEVVGKWAEKTEMECPKCGGYDTDVA